MASSGSWAVLGLVCFAIGCGDLGGEAGGRSQCEPACGGGQSGGSAGSGGSGWSGSGGSGGSGSGSGGSAGSVTPDSSSLFATLPETGSVAVTLHPGASVGSGEPTLVAFGLPFPRDTVDDVSSLRVRDASGGEIASHVQELARWNTLGTTPKPSSLRAALIYVEASFSGAPLEIAVEWGATRTLELGAQPPASSTWVAVTDEYPASAGVMEPAVYATLPPDWLSACLLRTRTVAAHSDPSFSWFDDSFIGSSETAVNEVDPGVVELIDVLADPEPWLFDRTLTLFGTYVRTGDVKWLRHAHRSAQFYASHVDASGNFDLKGEDLKYSYGQSLVVDLLLTGDVGLIDPIERVADAGKAWNPSYQPQSNFWTERHQTYALLAALAAFEVTGKTEHADRARAIAAASFALAKTPVAGWSNDGCMLHEFVDHEGDGGSDPVCSPWMSALFADAVFRYYIHSEDPAALEFLVSLGNYVQSFGIYTDTIDGEARVLPWYLASSVVQFSDSGPYDDIEHTCDVGAIVARAAWAQKTLGGDASVLSAGAADLIASCQANLANWYRPEGPSAGKAVWRLSPPRKFNWWFGSTLDLAWLVSDTK